MKVQELMTKEPRCCRADEALVAAARIMWEHDCGCVPVLDAADRLVGIVTDRDACMAAYTKGLRLDEIPVAAAMAKAVHSIRPEDSVATAEALLQTHQIRRLPVVDQAGKLVGLLSSNDLVRAAAREAQGPGKAASAERLVATLSAISAPRQLAAPQPAAKSPTVIPAAQPAKAAPTTAAREGTQPAPRPAPKGRVRKGR